MYLRRRVILELTKNVGCTSNKAGTPSNTLTIFPQCFTKYEMPSKKLDRMEPINSILPWTVFKERNVLKYKPGENCYYGQLLTI